MMQLQINNVRVIDPQSDHHGQIVDMLIEDGHIISIKKIGTKKGTSLITINNETVWSGDNNVTLCLSPGWVDVFADYCEPGNEHKETITSGLTAAVAGGFTDVFLVPNTKPAISTRSVVQYLLQHSEGHPVSLHPLGCITQNADGNDLAEMMDMYYAGAIAFSDGWKPVQNIDLTLKALEYVKAFNGIVIQLPVDATLSAGGLMNEGIIATRLGMQGIPEIAETLMIHRDIELLRYTGSKLHITGVSTASSLMLISKAKSEGLAVTCSVTPYHLALTDETLKNYESAYKVSPPLRTEEDRVALIQGLADGTIDCIASHHRPQDWDAKTIEFEYAANGMAVQELTYNIIWQAVKDYVSIDRLIEAMTLIPRDIFKLDAQKINIGNNCAMTIFTIGNTNTLSSANKQSIAYNNPFLEKEMAGKVLGIINKGKFIKNI